MSDETEPINSRMDQLDRQLIEELQADPRLAYATLGTRLGVTGMTAANRLQRLRQAGLVKLRVTPNLKGCDLTTEVIGLIQAEVGALAPSVDVLRASPYVLRIDHVTGEYDLTFTAAFPSETAMGMLVRDVQSVVGVRRLVVHHRLETVKDGDGWAAVWSEPPVPESNTYEVAPGTRIPDHLRPKVGIAAAWLNAFIMGDTEAVRRLSEPDIVFTIMPPQIGAGTFEGLGLILEQSQIASRTYRHFWHRIVSVSEPAAPYAVLIDALNTVERQRGQVRTAFARMAFSFLHGNVHRVLSLGQMELPDVPQSGEAVEQLAQAATTSV